MMAPVGRTITGVAKTFAALGPWKAASLPSLPWIACLAMTGCLGRHWRGSARVGWCFAEKCPLVSRFPIDATPVFCQGMQPHFVAKYCIM